MFCLIRGKGGLSNVKNGFGLFYIIQSLRSETSEPSLDAFHSNPISYAKLLSVFKYHLEGSNSLPYLLCHRRWPPSLLNSGDLLEVASQFLPSYHPTSRRSQSDLFKTYTKSCPAIKSLYVTESQTVFETFLPLPLPNSPGPALFPQPHWPFQLVTTPPQSLPSTPPRTEPVTLN